MANETNTQRGGLHAYSLKVAAGKTTKRAIRGTTIRVSDSPYPVNITAHAKVLNGQRGVNFTLEMKKFEKWFTDMEYDEIEVENPGDIDITVVLQLGYGDFVAEILSRTLAASILQGETFSAIGEGAEIIDAQNLFEVEWIPENLARKRVFNNWNAFISGGAGILEIWAGPPGLTYGTIFELGWPLDATFGDNLQLGASLPDLEDTAAVSFYLVNVDPIEDITVEYVITYLEEVYTADAEEPVPPPE